MGQGGGVETAVFVHGCRLETAVLIQPVNVHFLTNARYQPPDLRHQERDQETEE